MAVPTRIDPYQDSQATLYLVFAGLHRDARRGTGDLVAVSASHEVAREAFRTVRLRLADRDGWAELTAVSDGGKTRRLSWFGTDRWARPSPVTALLAGGDDAVAEARRRRLGRAGRRV
jgi:hypothetical protein